MKMLMMLVALAATGTVGAAERPSPPAVARYLEQCQAAGQRLWGVSLCAPVVIVEPETGTAWTSEAAPGPLPALRANTAFEWGGRTWIMLIAPPEDEEALQELLYHEAWHARQQRLGFAPNAAVAAHLDDWRQRYLMRLEWNALESALLSRGRVQRDHIRQALAFRARRHALSPAAAEAERAQMRHEGLASYTGAALSGAPVQRALAALRSGPVRPGLARSFAYVSAPAWGLLLDDLRPGWRQRLRNGADLPALAGLLPSTRVEPDLYGGTALLAEEQNAGLARDTRLRRMLVATSERAALRLPLAAMNMDFDPNQVSSAPDGSTLYGRIILRDRWGRIDATSTGLRISPDFTSAYAPWPLADGALQLAPGWHVAARPGGGADIVQAP